MGDTVVESGAEDLLLYTERCDVAEIVPESEGDCGELETASATSAVRHFPVTVFCGGIRYILFVAHIGSPLLSFF